MMRSGNLAEQTNIVARQLNLRLARSFPTRNPGFKKPPVSAMGIGLANDLARERFRNPWRPVAYRRRRLVTPPTFGSVPWPRSDEHLSGYLRRLARSNGLTQIEQFHSILGLRSFESSAGEKAWTALADATGVKGEVFEHMRLPAKAWQRPETIIIEGARFQSSNMVGQPFRFCAECLRADECVRSRWFLHHVTACNVHKTQLRDRCACGTSLRTRYITLDLECPSCRARLADRPSEPARTSELAFVGALLPAKDAAPEAAPGYMALPAYQKVAFAERLGRLVQLAADDRPFDRVGIFFSKKPEQIQGNRPITQSRSIVEDAMALLYDWPYSYHSLLRDLIDRAPYRTDAPPSLRRLQTDAGFLAARTLHDHTGAPVAFLNDERDRFMNDELGVRSFNSDAKPIRKPFARFAATIRQPAEPLRPEHYMNVPDAVALLGGTGAIDLIGWVEAGLVQLHGAPGGGHRILKQSVSNAAHLIENLPAEDGTLRTIDFVEVKSRLAKDYELGSALADIVSGHVGAVIRYPGRPALQSIAIRIEDLQRRQACCRLAHLMVRNEDRETARLRKLISAAWSDEDPITAREMKLLEANGGVTGRIGPFGRYYPIRAVIKALQANGHRVLFDLNTKMGDGRLGWHDLMVDPPRYARVEQ